MHPLHLHPLSYTLTQAQPGTPRMESDKVWTTISSQSKISNRKRRTESFWSQGSMRATTMAHQNPLPTLPPALISQPRPTPDLQLRLATPKRGSSPQPPLACLREPLATALEQQEEV